jgi:hypothetical protein
VRLIKADTDGELAVYVDAFERADISAFIEPAVTPEWRLKDWSRNAAAICIGRHAGAMGATVRQ